MTDVRVTQQFVEVAHRPTDATIRVSMQFVEVAWRVSAAPRPTATGLAIGIRISNPM